MKTAIIIWFFLLSYSVFGQRFVSDITLGEKIPAEINLGAYVEQSSENCNCRTFAMGLDSDLNDPNVRIVGTTASVFSLYYNKENTVVAKVSIGMNVDPNKASEDFQDYFKGDMMSTTYYDDYFFIESDFDSDLKYYSLNFKNYVNREGDAVQTVGLVNNTIFVETYIPNSSYEPRYKLQNTNRKTVVVQVEIDEAYGDLDKDGIEEKVVILDTGVESEEGTKRQILIYKKNGDDWTLWHTSEGAVMPGHSLYGSFDALIIERGCIVIRHTGGQRQKYFYLHRFRYQNNDWELIGATIEYYEACEFLEGYDYNFSTGKMIYTKQKEICNEEKDHELEKIEQMEFRKKLAELPKMDGFKIGENQINYPNLDKSCYF